MNPPCQFNLITGDGDDVTIAQPLRFILRHRLAIYDCAVAAQILNANFAITRKKSKMLARNLRTGQIDWTNNVASKNQPFGQVARNSVSVRIALFPND